MKKLLSLLMILSLVLVLAACSNNSGSSDKTASAAPSSSASSDKSSPEPTEAQAGNSSGIDLDLAAMSGTMVYSEVLNMQQHPEDYMGLVVRMKGPFSVTKTDTNTYFACIISDATACCASGIEFDLKGDYSYPADYPKPNTEITVTGTFTTYMEGKNKYLQLKDAEMTY